MHTTVKLSQNGRQALMLRSHHQRKGSSRKRITLGSHALTQCGITRPRKKSVFSSKSYRDALQRAFNNAKEQIFFNPDMQYFVTLTYAGIETDIEKAMQDVKNLVRQERRNGNTHLKYIYVFEWQKRGSLHIHMITNHALTTFTNKNGHPSLLYWRHGFTSMLTIHDFDSNFRPYLYLFKYMRKAERIGKSFVHSSRNLNNFKIVTAPLNLLEWRTVTQEVTYTTHDNLNYSFYRNFLCYDDDINVNQENPKLWQTNQSQSMRELVQNQRNLSRPSV